MIKYSRRAIKGLAYLFRRYNDIDVYVEDTSGRNMYQVLFERMLQERAKVNRIFQLGGRNIVIEECSKDQADASRRRLYIIDGDSDLILGIEAPKLKYLYRLSVYASENLVFTESAVIGVAVECIPNEPNEEIKRRIAFDEFLQEIVSKLVPLFVIYIAIRKIQSQGKQQIHIRTFGDNILSLCEDDGSVLSLSEAKIVNKVDQLKEQLINEYGYVRDDVLTIIREIETILPPQIGDITKIIPAKTCFLPILYHYLRRLANYSGTIEQLKVRLARHCELDIDPGLQQAIISTSQS